MAMNRQRAMIYANKHWLAILKTRKEDQMSKIAVSEAKNNEIVQRALNGNPLMTNTSCRNPGCMDNKPVGSKTWKKCQWWFCHKEQCQEMHRVHVEKCLK